MRVLIVAGRCLKNKAGSTLRSSRAVPHPSTNRALRRLTSEVGRDPVHSTRYGRQRWSQNMMTIIMCACASRHNVSFTVHKKLPPNGLPMCELVFANAPTKKRCNRFCRSHYPKTYHPMEVNLCGPSHRTLQALLSLTLPQDPSPNGSRSVLA